jgi:hypothetical protein
MIVHVEKSGDTTSLHLLDLPALARFRAAFRILFVLELGHIIIVILVCFSFVVIQVVTASAHASASAQFAEVDASEAAVTTHAAHATHARHVVVIILYRVLLVLVDPL